MLEFNSLLKGGQPDVTYLPGGVNLLRFRHTRLPDKPRQAATQQQVVTLCS